MTEPLFLLVDLLCGAGGTSQGYDEGGLTKVIVGVNHDPLAIATHKLNFSGVTYFEEDLNKVNMEKLKAVVMKHQRRYPNAKLILWASLDCSQHSKAKGGKAKEPDSRTMAWDLDPYIEVLQPDYIKIENVREFMDWGPLDDECQPIKAEKGVFFYAWRYHIRKMGYYDQWKMLNAADYGACTSRDRLFGCFYRPGLPMVFPKPTHAKNAANGLIRWEPVREVLDLEDHGRSIFTRKTSRGKPQPLAENSLRRILAGLKRHVGEDFLAVYYSNGGEWGSLSQPAPTVSTKDRMSLVRPQWLDKMYKGEENHQGIDEPSGTVMTKDKYALCTAQFLDKAFTPGTSSDLFSPAASITTRDHHSLVTAQWLMKYNSTSKKGVHVPPGINEPSPAVTTESQLGLVSAFILNPQWGDGQGCKIDDPCFTLIARMDKAPPHLVVTEFGDLAIEVYATDSPMTVKIKEYMARQGIVDIKMRMLKVSELKLIQGFPASYKMAGGSTHKKKQIGNAVVSNIPKAWAQALKLAV